MYKIYRIDFRKYQRFKAANLLLAKLTKERGGKQE